MTRPRRSTRSRGSALDKVIDIDQSPDRPHAALEPGDLHGRLHADPRAGSRPPRSQSARLRAGPLLVQREGRPLRGLRGRRRHQDRDALPARRLRHLRCLQGQALQPRDARGHFKGKSIADVLDMTVEEGAGALLDVPSIRKILETLARVGLGYLKLGQPATTLSGGEAQRVKLAKRAIEARRPAARSIFSTSRRPGCISPTSRSCSRCCRLRDTATRSS